MKNAITIRMGATHWDARVNNNGQVLHFDFRQMEKKQKNDFHRELMNAVRSILPTRKAA